MVSILANLALQYTNFSRQLSRIFSRLNKTSSLAFSYCHFITLTIASPSCNSPPLTTRFAWQQFSVEFRLSLHERKCFVVDQINLVLGYRKKHSTLRLNSYSPFAASTSITKMCETVSDKHNSAALRMLSCVCFLTFLQ